MGGLSVSRSEWRRVTAEFLEFFAGLGEVVVTDGEVNFRADDTGLSLAADGTSRSFMPLHDLGARWDRVTFDRENWRLVLAAEGFEYTYRVPTRLRR